MDNHTDQGNAGLRITAYRLDEYQSFPKIVPASADREWMDIGTKGWANRCLPLRVANQAGWHVLNECDFEVTWNGKPQVDAVKIKFAAGQKSRFVRSNFGHGILTWYLPFLFRTSPGYNLLVRGPANMPKDGVSALDGVVETDWIVATFTVNWQITRPFHSVRFSKDEPICLLLPQKRGELEAFTAEVRNIESQPELHRGYSEWIASRRAFVTEREQEGPRSAPPPWQGHYTRGTTIEGAQAPEHQVKLRLKDFHEREPAIPRAERQPESARDEAAEGGARLGGRLRSLFTKRR